MRGRDWLRIDGNSVMAGVGVIASPNPTSIFRRKMAVPNFAVSSTRKPPYSCVSRISVTFTLDASKTSPSSHSYMQLCIFIHSNGELLAVSHRYEMKSVAIHLPRIHQ
jgi:hypothetical protein